MSQPPPSAPVVSRTPPADRKFPCRQCGARLDFDPSSQALQCPYCGHREVIEPSVVKVQEQSWEDYWRQHTGEETTLAGRSTQVRCPACGAVVLLEDKVATDKCPYCGAFLENKPEAAEAMIPPGAVLPFTVDERQARDAFNRWIAGRWFAPTGLYQFANLGQLAGVYAPVWTFDSMTCTHYTGERGDDYTETETYTEQDQNGQTVTRTREVRKTRWTPVSGEVRHFFDDVLVYASRSLPEGYVAWLGPWDLPQAEAFRADFLSGFQTERYTVGLRDGFDRARAIMDQEIRRLCIQQIGGDHQQLHQVATQHVGVTFKHLLLPLWVAAYRYQDRPYRILVNGRTGKVVGGRPYSWIKITLFILVLVAAVVAAVFLFSQLARGAERSGGARAVAPARQLSRSRGDEKKRGNFIFLVDRRRTSLIITLRSTFIRPPAFKPLGSSVYGSTFHCHSRGGVTLYPNSGHGIEPNRMGLAFLFPVPGTTHGRKRAYSSVG